MVDQIDDVPNRSEVATSQRNVGERLGQKSTRFEKFQDPATEPTDELSEVDRYMSRKFDLNPFMDEAGKKDFELSVFNSSFKIDFDFSLSQLQMSGSSEGLFGSIFVDGYGF